MHNFRNYVKLELKFNSNLILFIGKNAQGKTNILESIFLSCTGRSHRTSKDRELIRWGQDFAAVKILVEKKIGPSMIEILIKNREKKKILINGIPAQRIGELMGHLNCVMFSPEDLKLVKEGPVERRRFMDMELSQIKPQYFYHLQKYIGILNQRNSLLKEINQKPYLRKTLPVWNEQLAEIGSYIIYQRHLFVEKLKNIAREIHQEISHHSEDFNIEYKSSIDYKSVQPEIIQNNFLKSLEENEEEDISRCITSRGCHRDDLIFTINDIDIRTYGSQGQQRTAVLSLKLAELELMFQETGEYPVLLLDDVMSELDSTRKKMLFQYLNKVQTFITATELESLPLSDMKDLKVIKIHQGEAVGPVENSGLLV